MKTTRHFEDALRLRPEIRREWCERVVAAPVEEIVQENGRRVCWGYIDEAARYLRVVLLPDGTYHTAFFDRGYARRRT